MTALAEPVYIDDTADVLVPEQVFTKQVGDKTVRLTKTQMDEFGRELDAIRNRVLADLGERDATYIRDVMKLQRKLEVYGRGMLFLGILPPFWHTLSLFNPVVYLVSGFRWSFFEIADVSVAVSLGMTLGFLALCMITVWWIFRTGYRLKT